MNTKELKELFSSSAVLFERPDTLQIDIEEIIHYGTLSGVGVGSPLETLAVLLPEPDYISDEVWYNDEAIELIYGDISIFIENDRVSEIYIPVDMEDGYIDGGKNCEVNYGVLEEVGSPLIACFLALALDMDVSYKAVREDDMTISFELLNHNTVFCFECYDYGNNFCLSHITL